MQKWLEMKGISTAGWYCMLFERCCEPSKMPSLRVREMNDEWKTGSTNSTWQTDTHTHTNYEEANKRLIAFHASRVAWRFDAEKWYIYIFHGSHAAYSANSNEWRIIFHVFFFSLYVHFPFIVLEIEWVCCELQLEVKDHCKWIYNSFLNWKHTWLLRLNTLAKSNGDSIQFTRY